MDDENLRRRLHISETESKIRDLEIAARIDIRDIRDILDPFEEDLTVLRVNEARDAVLRLVDAVTVIRSSQARLRELKRSLS